MKLVAMTIENFTEKLAEGTPFPGGGSVAALCGALAAALSSMVSNLTYGREKFKHAWEAMGRIRGEAEALSRHFLDLVDDDAATYQEVMAAYRLNKETEEEKEVRLAAVQQAIRKATLVPLETLRAAEKVMRTAKAALERGNPNTLTDAGAAVHLARAAAAIAMANVRINLASVGDDIFVRNCGAETEEIMKRVSALFDDSERHLEHQLG